MSYNQYGYVVASCPLNETEFTTAATRLNCTEDKYGRNQYTCVPKLDLSAIVEFCYRSTVGIYPKGICLGALYNGDLDALRCGHFTEGCPANSYIGADLYKFPACSQINTEQRCFYADPACPNETESFTTEDETIPTASTTLMNAFNTTTNISSTLTTPVEEGSADLWVRKKYREAEESVSEGTVRNTEKITSDLNHLHSSVTGQHVGEMLSILPRSVFGINGIYGIIVQGTEVTISCLSVGEEYYRNLKEGSLQKLSSVVKYSRPYYYLHKCERENLIKTFVDMGALSDNLH